MGQQALLLGVAVEAGDRAQPAHHRGACAAALFEVAGEALDVGTPRLEQAKATLLAPGNELALIQGIGVAGQAAVPGQEAGEREPLVIAERGVDDNNGR